MPFCNQPHFLVSSSDAVHMGHDILFSGLPWQEHKFFFIAKHVLYVVLA